VRGRSEQKSTPTSYLSGLGPSPVVAVKSYFCPYPKLVRRPFRGGVVSYNTSPESRGDPAPKRCDFGNEN
jgi:hypothetical protein